MWNVSLHNTRTGAYVMHLPADGDAAWTSRLSGRGRGTHVFPMRGVDIPRDLLTEISQGNKYMLAHRWGHDHVAYAGVISFDDWAEASEVLTLESVELREALLNARMTYGVNGYDPGGVTVDVSGKNASGTLRAVILAMQSPSSEWQLPIDPPADGSGGITVQWRFEEGLTAEELIGQVEALGYEVNFRPYIHTDNSLRFQTRIAPKITHGSPMDLPVRAPGSLILDPHLSRDSSRQVTGVIGFGNGSGPDRLVAFAPEEGSGAGPFPIRDSRINKPDILDQGQLQNIVNAEYEARKNPVEQWSFALSVWGIGPALAAPGAQLRLHSHGSKRLPDKQLLRSIALRGDYSYTVVPEVHPIQEA